MSIFGPTNGYHGPSPKNGMQRSCLRATISPKWLTWLILILEPVRKCLKRSFALLLSKMWGRLNYSTIVTEDKLIWTSNNNGCFSMIWSANMRLQILQVAHGGRPSGHQSSMEEWNYSFGYFLLECFLHVKECGREPKWVARIAPRVGIHMIPRFTYLNIVVLWRLLLSRASGIWDWISFKVRVWKISWNDFLATEGLLDQSLLT